MSVNARLREIKERAGLLVLEGEALRGALSLELGEAASALEPIGAIVRETRSAATMLRPVWRAARYFRERRKRAARKAVLRKAGE